MTTIVVTANIGGIDEIPPFPEQDTECNYREFNENDIIIDGDSRLKSKFPKMQWHKRLTDKIENIIWIDGSVRVSEKFVSKMLRVLDGYDMVVTIHPDRKNVQEEFKFMIDKMKLGDKYLNSRFSLKEIERQRDFFEGENYPLFSAGIHAKKNNDKVNAMMDEWWYSVLEYGNYDQAFYTYLIHKHNIRYNSVSFHNKFFKVYPHYGKKATCP